ncbi:hypothetical protein CEW89_06270 [Celeribacter ethanolicus]|uniref:Porin domain-containing protein n=1 Tax=Celeribacter ethanolicus TaxID=1758178 RepID=A0A291GB17_9RHOB|nr:hypothetical protein [Celeribacter ethanolicus]ATG47206.1 hypothetical protein CEW89_06270 [Celeribacter ethanolicus]
MIRLTALTFALASLASASQADTWLTGDGWIALGASNIEDQDVWLGGDGTWSTTWHGLGLSFGAFGTLGRTHETYGALSYSFGSARIEAGNPRPAYDSFARPLIADVMLPEALARTDSGFSRLTDGAITENKFLPYGLRYANTDLAVSLHYVDDYDTAVLSLGGGWETGSWRIETALEYVDGDNSDANAKLQGSRALGAGNFTGTLSYNEANDASAAMELAYRHAVSDRVALTELVSIPIEEPEEGVALLGANIYLRGATSLDLSGGYGDGDGLANAAIRFEF